MQIYTAAEAKLKKSEIQSRIVRGQVFIHPTDTIYGLGCSAKLSEAVQKIREIKQRPDTPFSVMAPSIEWIRENCIISKEAEKYLKQLPGPITLILKTKNHPVASEVAPNKDSIGVRIPDHWFHEIVKNLDIPIITTSVNVTGKMFTTSFSAKSVSCITLSTILSVVLAIGDNIELSGLTSLSRYKKSHQIYNRLIFH